MSYDFNALCEEIASHRRQAEEEDQLLHLQKALEAFETLSSHCPMTPVLWMQYAATAEQIMEQALDDKMQARQTRLQTLELGLQEFPGYALLQLHYVQLLMEHPDESKDKLGPSLESAIAQVGRGSHRNEGEWIVELYRLQAQLYAKEDRKDLAVETFVQRSRVPMKDANDSIMEEAQEFCREHDIHLSPEQLQRIEAGRRLESKVFSQFVTYEDDIDMAMNQEGILARYHLGSQIDWDTVCKSGDQQYGMGLGSQGSANAFIKYALACHRKGDKAHDNEDQHQDPDRLNLEQSISELAVSVFERGVAECPTVEALWLSYVRYLIDRIHDGDSLDGYLQSVVQRAVRNCPYSTTLVKQKLNTCWILSERGKMVLDPDSLMEQVQRALNTKFLPGNSPFLELYLTAIRLVKLRILFLLSGSVLLSNDDSIAFDDAEPLNSKKVMERKKIDEVSIQEISDLLEDISDMYDGVETLLKKDHSSWTEGRSLLWKERGQTEAYLLSPLREVLAGSPSVKANVEASQALAKSIRLHAPSHPDFHLAHIHHYINTGTGTMTSEYEVLQRIRRTRMLFQNAIYSVGRPKADRTTPVPSFPVRDYDSALTNLCHEWVEFERLVGSEKSIAQASKAIQKKMQKSGSTTQSVSTSKSQQLGYQASATSNLVSKRKKDDSGDERSAKKQKREGFEDKEAGERDVSTDELRPPQVQESNPNFIETQKSKAEFKAHPFTVRLSNLADHTEDMDIVDAFRAKCGAIVHARIMREKHQYGKGKSKGWGLVQFEERDSVEKALELNDVLGLHGKVIVVERSHMPAVYLVPPGMHRVKEKGEGKVSKRNQKRKERKMSLDGSKGEEEPSKQPPSKTKSEEPEDTAKAVGGFDVLAFRPRGVGHGSTHRKTRITLTEERSKSGGG